MPGPYGKNLRLGDHVIIVGVPGSGKTYFARKMIASARRVVFFDPHGDYERNAAQLFEPFALTARDLEGDYMRATVLAERSGDVDVADEFRRVAEVVREAENLVLVADEVGDYSASAAKTLRALHANGHKQGIVTVLVSQRAVDLPLGTRATATAAYSFLQTHPKDLERLADEFGEDFAAEAASWQPGDPPATWVRPRIYK